MAQKKLKEIRERALQDFDIIEALVLHRYGPIEIGENIVLIIVGAEHRADAFKACQWCIDELKKITPIWKMEYTPEGDVLGGGASLMQTRETHVLPEPVKDLWGRPLRSLVRVSVTDRCNLRCQYCMPEEEYVWLPRETLLTFKEIVFLTDLFSEQGVDRLRITGGEPLLRKDLASLIGMLQKNTRIQDIAPDHQWGFAC